MSSPRIDFHDVSPKQREVLEWKHAKRQQLRYEYLKEMLNPMRQTIITDTAIERYAALRIRHEFTQKFSTGHHAWFGIGFLIILLGTGYLISEKKAADERFYRSGHQSYADREFKFH